jgi:cytochrome P450
MRANLSVPKATVSDSMATLVKVMTPTLAKGVIIRRPNMVSLAEHMALDDRAVRQLQKLSDRYGPGPLMLHAPGPPRAVLLDPGDVHRVLDNAPEPFAPASREKRAALSHFEPKNALATFGAPRERRRAYNEEVLRPDERIHPMGEAITHTVEDELASMMEEAVRAGTLDWELFNRGWHRMVRRLVLGQGAREDHELTDMLAKLRARANWAFARPKDKALRRAFHLRLQAHIERGEADSLAAIMAGLPKDDETAPSHQAAQWFFAFDPGGMATFRTLALLCTSPGARAEAFTEIDGPERVQDRRYLRACFLESLRLWATTPAILRETTRETEWASGTMPAGTGILIFAPFFHRDDRKLSYAHRLTPELWLHPETRKNWPLVPFSAGPAICPAHNLVPFTASTALAAMLRGRHIELSDPKRLSHDRLPGTLDNFSLRFEVAPA